MPNEFAALLRAPVRVRVGGRELVLPYRPAAAWAAGLDRLHLLVAELAEPDDRDLLADLVMGNPRTVEELKAESLRILAEQGGHRWWEVGRLMATSTAPEILGRLVLAGVDPWQRSLGEWCAAVYAVCLKGQDEKGRMKFEFSLSIPPPGYEAQWDDGNDVAAWTQATAQISGR